MKIKGVIEDLKIFLNLKMIIVKIYLGISLVLLQAVWGQFSFRQFLVPAYTSQVYRPFPMQSMLTILICCACNFQSGSLFFVYFGFLCKSIQCLISTLTQGGEGGHLFRLTCSIVLPGGRNTASKYHWCVWGVLAVSGPHWVCPYSLRVCFPGLLCSGSRLLCRGTV